MKTTRLFGTVILLLLHPLFGFAASFSADMVETRRGKSTDSKLYLLDRLEQPEIAGQIPPTWPRAITAAAAKVNAGPPPAQPPSKPSRGETALPPGGKHSNDNRLVLILDASGSMWGQIKGTAKIAIAKKVMTELVDELPNDLNVGLTIYGHRRKGDCEDIEMVVPAQRIDPAAIRSRIKAISPKGKTPLAKSLIHVADTLKGQAGQKTIVLVTDGLESCDHDPCKVAENLASSGVIAKIHVVGFDLTGEAMQQLKCIVAPSGGLLVGARSADELKSALGEVVATALPHNLAVRGLDANGKPLYINVEVLKEGQTVVRRSGHHPRFSLPDGTYRIKVRNAAIDQNVVLDSVMVAKERLTEKEVVFAQGKLQILSLDANKKALPATSSVYKSGSDQLIKKTSGNRQRFTLVPGIYDIKVIRNKSEQWIRNLEMVAGGEVTREVVFAEARLKIRAVDANNKTAYSSGEVYHAGTSDLVHKSSGNAYTFVLQPGSYDAKVYFRLTKESKWLRGISLKAGDRLEQQVSFAFGKIRLTGLGPDGKRAYLKAIAYRNGSTEMVHQTSGNAINFTLVPGTYDIKAYARKYKSEKWLRGIQIDDGANLKEQIQF